MTRIPPVRRLLMDAKALIAKPENWIKGKYARDAKGMGVRPYSPWACQFCPEGAIRRAGEHPGRYFTMEAISLMDGQVVDGDNLIHFNDAPTTTHPMVMKLFNKAIRRAKEQRI